MFYSYNCESCRGQGYHNFKIKSSIFLWKRFHNFRVHDKLRPASQGADPYYKVHGATKGPLTCGRRATRPQWSCYATISVRHWSYKVFLFFFFYSPLIITHFLPSVNTFEPQIFRHLVLDLYLISCYNYCISEKEITMTI